MDKSKGKSNQSSKKPFNWKEPLPDAIGIRLCIYSKKRGEDRKEIGINVDTNTIAAGICGIGYGFSQIGVGIANIAKGTGQTIVGGINIAKKSVKSARETTASKVKSKAEVKSSKLAAAEATS